MAGEVAIYSKLDAFQQLFKAVITVTVCDQKARVSYFFFQVRRKSLRWMLQLL